MIRRVSLIGLGTMGPGIAARLARSGVDVMAYDIVESVLERSEDQITQADGVLDALGVHAPASGQGRVRFTRVLVEALTDTDLVLENVPEDALIKASVYRDVEAIVDADVLIATDTSGIPITTLQATLEHPGRFVGMHWSNPPHIVPMIEVIAGAQTRAEVVSTVSEFIREMGLLPVLIKKDVPGFVENRVLYAMLREVVDLVEHGVIDAEDMDTCVSWGIGFKTAVIGPMALLDMAGLDIYRSVSSFLNKELCTRANVSPLVAERHDEGRLGLKSGSGIYDYDLDAIPALQRARADKLIAIRRVLESKGG